MDRREVLLASNALLAAGVAGGLPSIASATEQSALDPVIKYLTEADSVAEKLGYGDPALRGAYHNLVMASLSQSFTNVFGTTVESPSWVPFVPFYGLIGGSNPDSLYYFAPIDPQGIYRISGRHGSEPLSTISMAIGGDHLGKFIGSTVGEIDRLALKTDADRNYSFILSVKPAPQYSEQWIELDPRTTALLSRSFVTNSSQIVGVSAIERLDRPPTHIHYTPDEVAHKLKLVAAAATDGTQLMLKYMNVLRERGAERDLILDDQTNYTGLAAQIYFFHFFSIAADEALIFESDVPKSPFWSLSSFDPLYTNLEYVHHQSSLNDHQVRLDADGKVRIVLAISDPGVANWLDTGEWLRGGVMWRWDKPETTPKAIMTRVKLKDLKNHLPKDTLYLGPKERQAALSARKAFYQRRTS